VDPCILTVERLTKFFGNLMAVCNLSFELGREEILGVIGPNGAGKANLNLNLPFLNGFRPA
jgi:branched-chain amino acid transport system ATP-binding protein